MASVIDELRREYEAQESVFNEVSDPRLQQAACLRMQAVLLQMAAVISGAASGDVFWPLPVEA